MEMFNLDQNMSNEQYDSFDFQNIFDDEVENENDKYNNYQYEFGFENEFKFESEYIIQKQICDKYQNQILEVFYKNNIKQKKSSLPLESKMILLKWLDDHKDNPYPSIIEFELLMNKSQLSKKQIKIFLVNHRSRFLNRHPNKDKNNLINCLL
jgi:hypothetical protein